MERLIFKHPNSTELKIRESINSLNSLETKMDFNEFKIYVKNNMILGGAIGPGEECLERDNIEVKHNYNLYINNKDIYSPNRTKLTFDEYILYNEYSHCSDYQKNMMYEHYCKVF